MKSSAKKIELASVDDLFSTEEGRQDAKLEKIQEIPLSELHPFRNHPFKVKDDEAMMETADSIKQYGVLVPAIARPDPEGGYELVAGHRRHRASELAEKETMPVIVRDLDDDAATIIMVDSNLQRESLLPSERAFAYKMKLDAMKRQAGRPSKENVSQVGTQKRSDQLLAEQVGQSRNQIQRYIRLTELIPELMDMVDEKKIALNPAYELSFLKKEEQVDLLDAMDSEQATPSLSQAQRLKKYSQEGHLTLDMMRVIMGEEKKSDLDRVTFTSDTLRKSNTEKTITYGSSTDSIPFREPAAAQLPERKGRDAMSVSEMESYRDLILENIEYDHLCREFTTYREDLDEIVELMVETVCAKRKTTRIAGSDFPHEVVRSRFLKLDCSHIEFVMECLRNNTTEIRNMKQYLLAVLFNAPTTISNHYTAQVNHDMYAGGW